MLGITNMTRRTESEFSGFSPKQYKAADDQDDDHNHDQVGK